MSDLTIVLRGETADKLRKLVAEQKYAHPEDAVADALDALEGSFDADLDTWLRTVIADRIDAIDADPTQTSTPDEVRARLLGKA